MKKVGMIARCKGYGGVINGKRILFKCCKIFTIKSGRHIRCPECAKKQKAFDKKAIYAREKAKIERKIARHNARILEEKKLEDK
ncbi:MAG: hypothetical protein OQK32_01485 [Gammaproteobacteria bacterium]|nr:hypothetical protein [Gammaproteobacteria bacterium]